MAKPKKSNSSTFKLITLLLCIFILVKFGHFSSVEKDGQQNGQSNPIFQTYPGNQTQPIDANGPGDPAARHDSTASQPTSRNAANTGNTPLNDPSNDPDDSNDSNDQINQTEAKNLLKEYLLKKLDLSQPTNLLADTKVPGFLLDIFETKSF